jgi:ubiquinone/menaquinone biosynthesis C-methylase UbiE
MADQYKRIANWYDFIFEPLNSGLRQIGLKMYAVEEGMNVLDIGCGTGAHLKIYQQEKCHIFGIDLSESMLQMARTKLGHGTDLRHCDAANTPFSESTFDLILISTVLHEMRQQVRLDVLTEARRILKTDGRLLLIDFHPGPLRKLKGYYSKIIITIAEISAGREHFKNYRHFIRMGGLPNLIDTCGFQIIDSKIVSGGNFGIFLLAI